MNFDFSFQVRESPTPLNIPNPTPAPDLGGPTACLRKVAQSATNRFSNNSLVFHGSHARDWGRMRCVAWRHLLATPSLDVISTSDTQTHTHTLTPWGQVRHGLFDLSFGLRLQTKRMMFSRLQLLTALATTLPWYGAACNLKATRLWNQTDIKQQTIKTKRQRYIVKPRTAGCDTSNKA